MKNWQETEIIFKRLRELGAAGESAVLAVIVQIEGSTYRRPGAKLLIEPDGCMIGNVSGGCLEQDVKENALSVLASGEPRIVHYDTGEDEDKVWGMGLGCNGKVDLFLQRIAPDRHASFVDEICALLDGDEPFTVHMHTGQRETNLPRIERNARGTTCWQQSVFTETLLPPPIVLLCGAGEDAIPLAQYAHQVGFRVHIADHRSAYLTPDRFPWARKRMKIRPDDELSSELSINDRTLAVVKTHTLKYDAAWAHTLLATECPYIGLLGPRDRRDQILNEVDPRHHTRIYGPVGLDIGGEGPEQVAQSIVSEMLAVWYGREPRHLRERETAIHTT